MSRNSFGQLEVKTEREDKRELHLTRLSMSLALNKKIEVEVVAHEVQAICKVKCGS